MCTPASFVLTKDKVFWSKITESHSAIIDEYKLHEDGARGINLACVEITPPNNDYRLPLEQWVYKLDDERKPHWYDAAEGEARVRAVLPEWIAAKIVLLGQKRKLTGGDVVLACYGQVRAYGSSQVTACDSSQVRACGSSQVTAYGSSQVTACDSSQVTAYGSSQVTAINDSAVVQAYHAIDPSVLKSSKAVLIDRSGDTVLCHVGKGGH